MSSGIEILYSLIKVQIRKLILLHVLKYHLIRYRFEICLSGDLYDLNDGWLVWVLPVVVDFYCSRTSGAFISAIADTEVDIRIQDVRLLAERSQLVSLLWRTVEKERWCIGFFRTRLIIEFKFNSIEFKDGNQRELIETNSKHQVHTSWDVMKIKETEVSQRI